MGRLESKFLSVTCLNSDSPVKVSQCDQYHRETSRRSVTCLDWFINYGAVLPVVTYQSPPIIFL